MAESTTIAGLGDAIADAVREYTDDVIAGVPKIVDQNAKAALADLKSRSPEKSGRYAKGWRIKKVYSRSGFEGRVLHNLTDYQLSHLLEFGHALKNGGRAGAIPHIEPVAREHLARFEGEMGRLVQSGGRR